MRQLILAAFLLSLGAGLVPAQELFPLQAISVTGCPMGTGNPNDGCSGAPSGTAQLGTGQTNALFGCSTASCTPSVNFAPHSSPYTVRPQWNVAGVDYYVGVPSGTVLKDPTGASLPSCASYSSGSKTVTINSTNCTLDSFNFCQHASTTINQTPSSPDGISVLINASGATVENSYFCRANSSNGDTDIDVEAGGATILSNEHNGLNTGTVMGPDVANDDRAWGVFANSVPGGVVFKYNYVHNLDAAVAMWGSNGTDPYTAGNSMTVEYNLFLNYGLNNTGNHAEDVKFCGTGTWSGIANQYNTYVAETNAMYNIVHTFTSLTAEQNMQDLGCGSGIVTSSNTSTNNVIINEGTGGFGTGPAGFNMYFGGNSAGGRSNVVTNNYLDCSGGAGCFYNGWPNNQFGGGSSTSNTWFSSITGNINMIGGGACSPPSWTDNSGTVQTGSC